MRSLTADRNSYKLLSIRDYKLFCCLVFTLAIAETLYCPSGELRTNIDSQLLHLLPVGTIAIAIAGTLPYLERNADETCAVVAENHLFACTIATDNVAMRTRSALALSFNASPVSNVDRRHNQVSF